MIFLSVHYGKRAMNFSHAQDMIFIFLFSKTNLMSFYQTQQSPRQPKENDCFKYVKITSRSLFLILKKWLAWLNRQQSYARQRLVDGDLGHKAVRQYTLIILAESGNLADYYLPFLEWPKYQTSLWPGFDSIKEMLWCAHVFHKHQSGTFLRVH